MYLTLKSSFMKKSLRLLWKLCKGNDWQARVGLICRTNAQSDHKSPWNRFSERCISPSNDYRENKIKKKKRLLKICESECPRKSLWRAFVPSICMADVAHSAGLAFWGVAVSGSLCPSQQKQLPSVVILSGVRGKVLGLRDREHHILWYMSWKNTSSHMGFCATTPPQVTALQGGEDFSVS